MENLFIEKPLIAKNETIFQASEAFSELLVFNIEKKVDENSVLKLFINL